ncbi:B4GALT1 [Branchiostoma lanceolatum]|uniref:B4GALT1 protein n=1 Tax=Branchiostoma lanceolatum TaxID=7740 RepID=A0A8K0A8L1_BRALA|nr:B4GALT1 [Branchiostoma lanceolatum]
MAKLKKVQGGKWSPPSSLPLPSEKVAILVPYKEREEHLKMFLLIMHPFLQRQGLDYGIYVIEQHGDEPMFCKGLLYNIGYTLAKKDEGHDCFIFHDVDLIPESDANVYSCQSVPSHLSVAIDVYNYTLPYERFLGGVVAFTTSQYEQLNGYSNLFCGWGGEDDDMFLRLYKHRMALSRLEEDVGRYKMMRHKRRPENPARHALLEAWAKRAAEHY